MLRRRQQLTATRGHDDDDISIIVAVVVGACKDRRNGRQTRLSRVGWQQLRAVLLFALALVVTAGHSLVGATTERSPRLFKIAPHEEARQTFFLFS